MPCGSCVRAALRVLPARGRAEDGGDEARAAGARAHPVARAARAHLTSGPPAQLLLPRRRGRAGPRCRHEPRHRYGGRWLAPPAAS